MMKANRLVIIFIVFTLFVFTKYTSSSDDHVLTSLNEKKTGVITSPEFILDNNSNNLRLKRDASKHHKKNQLKEFLLNGFGFDFHLKLKPIEYNFFLNGSDSANRLHKTPCFYNGIVNDDTTSSVYISLCQPNKMIGGFHYNFTEYFIEPHDNEKLIEETKIIYLNNSDRFNLNSRFDSSSSSSDNKEKHTAYHYQKHILYKFDEKKFNKNADKKKEEEELSTCGLLDEDEYKKEREHEEEILEKKKNDPLKDIINRRKKRDHDDSERSFSEYIAGIEESQVGAAYLELIVFVDGKMAEFYGNGLNDYIYTLLFITTEIFRHPSMNNLVTVIISDIVYLNDLERNRSAYSSIKGLPDITRNGESSLNSFCKWQTEYRKVIYDEKRIQVDAALLITKEDICQDTSCHTIGMAKMGQLCDMAHSCAIVEDNGLTTPYSIAHEIGHILNMYHTTSDVCKKYPELRKPSPDDSFTYIMAPLLDLTRKSYRWSRCSIKMLIENLKRDNAKCLFNKPQPDLSFYNQRYVNQIMKTIDEGFRYILPGERYGIDEQCKQIRGKNSSACATTTACHVLWCWIPIDGPDGVRYACANTHAKWADGTSCSSNKFCISGTCIDRASYQVNRIDGQWSQWSEWSDCSRTCGGGVAVSTRKCDNPKPQHGGLFCDGNRIQYKSCNIKICAEGPVQFRDLQCRRGVHDENIVKRILNEGYNLSSTWTSYYHDTQKCKLWCTPLYGGTNVVSFGVNVIDGTKCDRYTSDICVHGKCEEAGCDNVLYSKTKHDNCYVCGGNNSTCRLVEREIEVPINYEYQPVFEIPPYVTNIKIRRVRDPDLTEMLGNDGYIAARTAISYLFNMGWYILTSTKKGIAVVGGGYLDYIVDNRTEEVVISHGKIQEKIYFQYLGVTAPDGRRRRTKFEISYYESIKPVDSNSNSNGNNHNSHNVNSHNGNFNQDRGLNNAYEQRNSNKFRPLYVQNANHDTSQPASWSQDGKASDNNGFCNKECSGVMLAQPACISDKTNEVVDDKLCHGKSPKTPAKYVPCNIHCKYTAINLNSNCRPLNGSCGAGTMTYNLKCLRQDHSDENMVAEVDASNCEMEKFIRSLKSDCHVPCERFEWQKNDGDCNPKCGVGWRRVSYVCYDNTEARKTYDSKQCREQKPSDYDEPCTTNCYSWRESEWTICSRTCGIGQRTRSVSCYYEDQRMTDEYCQHMPKPASTEDCHLATCQSAWRTGPWSECSVKCGRGERQRAVACTLNEHERDPSLCDYETRPADTEICDDTSCSQWVPTAWSECSTRCGAGVRTRKLYCEMNGQYVHESKCNQGAKPAESSECKGTNCAVWKTDDWSQCSTTCGDGLQKRNVYCSNVYTNDVQSCPPSEKPASQRPCQLPPCPRFMWKTGNYSACTTSCGPGWKTRSVFCTDLSGQMVDKAICEKQLSQPEPTYFASCRAAFCADWKIGNWSQCSVTCGQGSQARTVSCYEGARLVADNECDVTIKPSVVQTCSISCPNKRRSEWKILSKSGCSKTCGGGWIIVKSECQYEDGAPSTYCDESSMPTPRIKCNEEACPTWVNGSWSACSTTCGQGIKTRRVACQLYNGTYTNDLNCNSDGKPIDRQQCVEQICPKWSAGPWSECNQAECVQRRSIRCVNSKGTPINEELCDKASKPLGQKECDDIGKCDIYKKSQKPFNSKATSSSNNEIPRSSVRIHHSVYTPCSSPCISIPGIQTRNVFCRLFNLTDVALEYCGITEKTEKRTCYSQKPCVFNIVEEPGTCKGECSRTGVREIRVKCLESITQREFNLSYCNVQAYQSSRMQSCIVPACTTQKNVSYFEWKTGAWSKCQGGCGFSNKTRVIFCWYNKKNFTVKESYCRKLVKPVSQTPCIDPACGYGWFVSDWSQCSKSCSKGQKTRNVLCIKLSPEGHVLNETSNKCKLANKPISAMECNNGDCSSGFAWRPSSWSQCSTSCGFGYQRRNITCVSTSGSYAQQDQSKCDRKMLPIRYQICYSNCYAKSCTQLKTVFGIYKDGEYNLNVSNSVVKIYCRNMNTNKPLEYITLKSELENYSEIYDKKLINPFTCNPRWGPRYNIKCDLCSNETVNGFGTTAFSKIRLDIKTLKIISDDFTFSTARYGNPVPFGIAGDCYSTNPECIQGSMHINLNGTNFSFTPNVSWKSYGQNAVSRIYITSDYYKAYGVCGGYCGGCKPDAKVGLQLRVVV